MCVLVSLNVTLRLEYVMVSSGIKTHIETYIDNNFQVFAVFFILYE